MALSRSRFAFLCSLVSASLTVLTSAAGMADAPDKRMQDYFDCIDSHAGPAIRNRVAEQGLLADSDIAAEVTKAEGSCQKQIAAAVAAVHQKPKNGTQGMTDDQIRQRLRSMVTTGYILNYGQQ